jgi:HSF-type DNA-binding
MSSHPTAAAAVTVTATPSSSSSSSGTPLVAVPIAAPTIPQQPPEGGGGLLMLSTASSSGPPSSGPIQSSHSFDSPHELAASVLLLAARGYDRKRILEHVSNSCRESDMKEAEEQAKKRKTVVGDNNNTSATITTTTTTTSECSILRHCTSESDQDHGHEEDDDNNRHQNHPCQVSPVSHGSKGSSSSAISTNGVVAAGAISPDRSQHSRSSSYDNIDHHHLKNGQEQQQQALDESRPTPALPQAAPTTNSPTGPPALSNTAIIKNHTLGASSPLLEAAMAIENAANMAAAAAAASANNSAHQQQHTAATQAQYPTHVVTTATSATATTASSASSNNNSPTTQGGAVTSSNNRGLVEGLPLSHLPAQLFNLLQDESKNNNVLQWLPDGKAWRIVRWDALRKQVLPKYFSFAMTVDSFLAQLTEWGFVEIQNGPHAGAYQHAVRIV